MSVLGTLSHSCCDDDMHWLLFLTDIRPTIAIIRFSERACCITGPKGSRKRSRLGGNIAIEAFKGRHRYSIVCFVFVLLATGD